MSGVRDGGADDWENEAELLRAIGHPVRLRILAALGASERAVGEIETMTGIAQPGLSQQLGLLRKAEIVQTRRDGKQVFYRLVPERLGEARAIVQGLMPAGTPIVSPGARGTSDDPIHRPGGAAVFARITD